MCGYEPNSLWEHGGHRVGTGPEAFERTSESHSVVSDSFNPVDYTVHGIVQARILEWVAFPFSRGASQPRDRTQVSLIAGGFFTS